METRFWVGTSGWHYRHWRGGFYPKDMPTDEWFEFYAKQFATVELNNSFYRLPKDSAWDLWAEQAPRGFHFAVKASRYITHVKRLNVEPASIDKLFHGASRLGAHLGPMLYQLPPSFHRTEENVARLERFLGTLPRGRGHDGIRAPAAHVFEFRHASWFVEETFAQLERADATFCSFDMPGIECPLRATNRVLYMRFHGTDGKYGGGYGRERLRRWCDRLREAADGCHDAYVYFNNDIGGHAPRDAAVLQELLRQ